MNVADLKGDLKERRFQATCTRSMADSGATGTALSKPGSICGGCITRSGGQRYGETLFMTEDEACERLWVLLTSGRMVRYRIDHPISDEPETRGSA
jgi:hypothetical protein